MSKRRRHHVPQTLTAREFNDWYRRHKRAQLALEFSPIEWERHNPPYADERAGLRLGRRFSPTFKRRNDRKFWKDYRRYAAHYHWKRDGIMRRYIKFRDDRFHNQALGRWVAKDKGLPKEIFDEYM